MSTNQLSYISKYNKENYKMYQFRIKRSDQDLIDKLDNTPNRNAFLINLISEKLRSDILTIKQIKERIKPVMERHGVKDVYLFGSYARGEATSSSDVDIYCDSGDVDTLFKEVAFNEELEEALGKKVDVVTIGSHMHEFFRQQLEEDMIKIC